LGFLRKCVILLGVVLAAPFWSYGTAGLIKYLQWDEFIREYMGLTMYDNPVKCGVSLAIGCLIIFGVKAMADRIR